MNDPGLEEPIDRAARYVEDRQSASDEGDADGVDNEPGEFLDPTRWWFASTAIPLIAACFGPIASAFNICALASHWRISIPSGLANDVSNSVNIPDPTWLLAVNAVSLFLAVLANIALSLNLARRASFSTAQPVTIVGWYLSSFILVALVVASNCAPSMQLGPGMNRTFTQSYYYAIWAAILYFIIASLMIVTVWGALAGHYEMKFRLTMSQRTLMLQSTGYVVYLLAGAGIWHQLEGWSYPDAIYWANYTLLTIGLGDLTPSTTAGQGLLFPYAIGGIIILGLVISSIRSLILERGKRKLSARMAEKIREKAVAQLHKYDGKVKLDSFQKQHGVDDKHSHKERRKQEFVIMRKIQSQADLRRKWSALLTSTIAGIALWFLGAVVFWRTEQVQHFTYFQSLYMCYVSLLTIGYGDFYPETDAGKSFYVFWSLLAVPTLTILISNMGDTVIRLVRDVTLFIGELTILPGDDGIRNRFRKLLQQATGLVKGPRAGSNKGESKAQGLNLRENMESESSRRQDETTPGVEDVEKRGKQVERDESRHFEAARTKGDLVVENTHLYRYTLMKEIRRVIKDIGAEPPKKYTYAEWSWFLQLLGEDESDEDYHRSPRPTDDLNKYAEGRQEVGKKPHKVKWSWLGERSPLLGDTDEAEWVLDRMSIRLEQELRKTCRLNNLARQGEAASEGY